MKIDKRTWHHWTAFLQGILAVAISMSLIGIINWITGLRNATALIFMWLIFIALAFRAMQVLFAKIGEKLFKHTPGVYDEDNPHNLLK